MASLWGEIKDIPNEMKPEDIIRDQFEELSNLTDGFVIGRVENYAKTLDEMSISTMGNVAQMMQTAMVASPQMYLGEKSSDAIFMFEVFVTMKIVPNYKYRFMFVQHGVTPYPVVVEIEKDICTSIEETNTTFTCQNKEEFELLLQKVLKSERVMTIVSRLASYRQ